MARMHVPVRLRWSDVDGYGHVNNVAMMRLLEEARIHAFWATDEDPEVRAGTAVLQGTPGSDTLAIVARQEIEYVAAMPYLRQPVDVQMWIGRFGGSSLEICYEVCSPVGAEPFAIYARASSTVVLVDAASGKPRRMTEAERDAWAPLHEEPIVFANRR